MGVGRIVALFLIAGLLAACGGGGGGGGESGSNNNNNNGDFTLATNTANFTGNMAGYQSAPVEIRGTLKNVKSDVHFIVDISKTNLIQYAYVDLLSDSTGELVLVPTPASELAVGQHVGTVTVRACKNANCSSQYSGSPKTITINYTVTAPEFSVLADAVNLTSISGKAPAKAVVVALSSSEPPATYGHSMSSNATGWLSIQTSWDGTDGTAAFIVTKELPVGTYTENVSLFAHGASLNRSVPVTYTVKDSEHLSVSQSRLSFTYQNASSLTESESFFIAGKTTTAWALETAVNWLSLSATEGSTADSTAIIAVLNENVLLLPRGIHKTSITVKNLDDEELSIQLPVIAYVTDAGVEVTESTANVLDFEVTDVVTDTRASRLFISDKLAKRVYEVDLATGLTTRYFEFEKMPENMTISPDGKKLYIALLDGEHSSYWWDEDQSGAIAIMDLARNTLLGSFEINIDPYDLVATDAGTLVVTSGSGQWTSIKTYDAAFDELTGVDVIREGSVIALHPSQEWIVATEVGSFNNIIKFSINDSGITGEERTYHPDAHNYGVSWFAPDGSYLITRGGSVFQTESMTYERGLFTDWTIMDLAFDADSDTAVMITSRNTLDSYNLTDYSFKATLADDLVDPRFVISQGGKTYVISYENEEFLLTEY